MTSNYGIEDKSVYLNRLLNEGAKVCVDEEFELENFKLPPWYDPKLFKKGQKFYLTNIFAMFVGMLCGLIAVLAIPSILSVLICTRKSSNPATAYRRYLRTIFHVVTWNGCSVNEDSPMWKSLIAVRKTHLSSSRFCESSEAGIISQKDMALTQFGFMGFITLRANLLGINASEEFLEATVHFWRVVGYMLGIKDEYNLCTDSWATTKPRLEITLSEVYRPAFLSADKAFLNATTALIEGLWSFNPFLSVGAHLFFAYRLAGCEGYEYLESDYCNTIKQKKSEKLYKKLTIYNRMVLFMLVFTHQFLLRNFVLRWYFNFQIYFSLFLIYYFPFLAFPRFGFKHSYVRILKRK